MNLNYAIFRSEPIYTIQDLAQIGSHNKREKRAYNSNPDIKIELSKNNIELVPLADKYIKGFYNITKDYKKEHEERMKTVRPERKKSFSQMLNSSKNVVADELLFTATSKFFKDMTTEDIMEWANTCMDFVYKDLGYTKEQVLHSVIHMDETTPHIHCVVFPLVRKFDKRTKSERYTISKKVYIKDKIHLSELQDKYHERLVNNGFDLERGIKGSDAKHQKVRDLKRTTRNFEKRLTLIHKSLDNAMTTLEDKMKSNKAIPFDKKHLIIEKDTFDSMNNVIKETKKAIYLQPKIEQLFNNINDFSKSHQALEKENKSMEKEMKYLNARNQNLMQENNTLKSYIKAILKAIKQFFRHLLQIGNEPTKEATTSEIKDYYDNNNFDMYDVYDISKDTTKEKELLDYVGFEKDYYKSYDKDDYDIRL